MAISFGFKIRGLMISFFVCVCVCLFVFIIFFRISFDVITFELFMERIDLFITTSSRVTCTLEGKLFVSEYLFAVSKFLEVS